MHSILYFLFVKVVTVSIIYTFFRCIQEDEIGFAITLSMFYLVERFGSGYAIIQNPQDKGFHLIGILVLTPFALEEFFMLIVYKCNYNQFISQKIDGQALGISVRSTPMLLMLIIRLGNSPHSIETLVPGILAHISLFLALLIIWNNNFFSNDHLFMQGRKLLYILEGIVSLLHFTTYLCLLWMNFDLVPYFYAYFLAFYLAISIIMFKKIVEKRIGFQKGNDDCFAFIGSFFILIKQYCQIDFDQRFVASEEIYPFSMRQYGKYLYDYMIYFSMGVKGFLLATFLLRVIFAGENEDEISSYSQFIWILISLSTLSWSIYAYRYYKYVVYPLVYGVQIAEIFTLEEFKELKRTQNEMEYQNVGNKKNILKFIRFPHPKRQGGGSVEENQFAIDCLLSQFENVEMLYNHRQFRSYEVIAGRKVKSMEVHFYPQVSISKITDSILRCEILKQIRVIRLNIPDEESSKFLISACIQANAIVRIEDIVDKRNDILINEYNHYVNLVQSSIINAVAFDKIISPFQKFNPNYIFYDLYDS